MGPSVPLLYLRMAAYRPRVSLCTDPRPPSVRSSQPLDWRVSPPCEDSPIYEDFTIIIDSLSSINLLKSTQRKDFPLWLYRPAERQLLIHVVSLINRRAAASIITRFVKVKVDRAEPFNEAADLWRRLQQSWTRPCP